VRRIQLAPSILTADFARLGEEIASVAGVVDWVHLDVMDGHYVDNLTFGPSVVEAVRQSCTNPLHVHLMISEPARYAREFARAGATRISFHPEVIGDVASVIDEIHAQGADAGLAIHPDVDHSAARPYLDRLAVLLMMTVRPGFGGQEFMIEVVPKIRRAREMVTQSGAVLDIEVDGGVKESTLVPVVEAGADIVVAGSAIFDRRDAPGAARRLRARLDAMGGPEG
jgi:ribulose-phosphate 3-epimerase